MTDKFNKIDTEQKIKEFLGKFQEVRKKYFKEEIPEEFNIFRAMRNDTDEVRLHSRFIASLLDPYAPHGMDDYPLRMFLETIGMGYDILEEEYLDVQPGYEDKNEYENIDILIKSDTHAIIIENKINHFDTNHEEVYVRADGKRKLIGQLERYYYVITKDDHCPPENTEVIYLTKDGKLPSLTSTGGTNPYFPELAGKVRCISYPQHIRPWLHKLLSYKNLNPLLRYEIEQYIQIIDDMTITDEEVKENNELQEIFGSMNTEERKLYRYLKSKEIDVCWHTADDLFHDIIRHSEGKFEIDCLELNGECDNDMSHYDQIIADALHNIISWRKHQTFDIYFKDAMLFPFVGIDSGENFYMGIEKTYINEKTSRKNNIPSPIIKKLIDEGYKDKGDYIILPIKYTAEFIENPIEYFDYYLDLNRLDGNTIAITNNEERDKFVMSVFKQFKDMVKQVKKEIIKSRSGQ